MRSITQVLRQQARSITATAQRLKLLGDDWGVPPSDESNAACASESRAVRQKRYEEVSQATPNVGSITVKIGTRASSAPTRTNTPTYTLEYGEHDGDTLARCSGSERTENDTSRSQLFHAACDHAIKDHASMRVARRQRIRRRSRCMPVITPHWVKPTFS